MVAQALDLLEDLGGWACQRALQLNICIWQLPHYSQLVFHIQSQSAFLRCILENPLGLARVLTVHLIGTSPTCDNSPRIRMSSPSPISFILPGPSLHIVSRKTSQPPPPTPISLTGRMLALALPGLYWPDSSAASSSIDCKFRACALHPPLPAHWSTTQLVHSPTCPPAWKIYSNPSQSITSQMKATISHLLTLSLHPS